jgi:hypothetical protein
MPIQKILAAGKAWLTSNFIGLRPDTLGRDPGWT